jgi:hypothetical protein
MAAQLYVAGLAARIEGNTISLSVPTYLGTRFIA